MRRLPVTLGMLVLLSLVCVQTGSGYPLDGGAESGIQRLRGYQLAQQEKRGPKLWPGQLLGSAEIQLRLETYDGPDFDRLPEDPTLSGFLAEVLRDRDPSYGMVLVDISNPARIRWAGLRPDVQQNPGSVGKLVTMLGLFHVLAEAFPDIEDRGRVLREARSAAGDWVSDEIHEVPKWNAELQKNEFSVIVPTDEFTLAEWLDHAISASANGAGAIVWREAILIKQFGARYPVSAEERERFFATTPKTTLARIAREITTLPLENAHIDTKNLQQGSFWTTNSKKKVPGILSFATPREVARLVFRMEQGRLVDRWSSLEMKKYMYLTKRRNRYSYAPELGKAAVFFKSGSLYACRAEPGYRCAKYKGNVKNLMNSVAIVETQAEPRVVYIATLMSNVLRFNSAWDHARIAAAVHATILTDRAQALREEATAQEMDDAGKGN